MLTEETLTITVTKIPLKIKPKVTVSITPGMSQQQMKALCTALRHNFKELEREAFRSWNVQNGKEASHV